MSFLVHNLSIPFCVQANIAIVLVDEFNHLTGYADSDRQDKSLWTHLPALIPPPTPPEHPDVAPPAENVIQF